MLRALKFATMFSFFASSRVYEPALMNFLAGATADWEYDVPSPLEAIKVELEKETDEDVREFLDQLSGLVGRKEEVEDAMNFSFPNEKAFEEFLVTLKNLIEARLS